MVVDTGEEAMVVVLATTAVGWVTWPRRRRQFIFFSAANCFFYDLIETNILSSCSSVFSLIPSAVFRKLTAMSKNKL
ncbi:uncharacterized protein DS421_13g424140 [Arachis hypogaea]|nr:uncharacterized protein DS421_13g424140 [Arachis hypogaea]